MAGTSETKSRMDIPWRALTMVGAVLLIWAIFSVTTDGIFLTPRNLSNLFRQMAVTSILAVGMVLVIVAGQIDLSVGALTGFLGALSAMMFVNHGWPLMGRVPPPGRGGLRSWAPSKGSWSRGSRSRLSS
jgi:D-xylose transport system permease protein